MHEVSRLTELTATIVAAHVARSEMDSASIPDFLSTVWKSLKALDSDHQSATRGTVEIVEPISAPASAATEMVDGTASASSSDDASSSEVPVLPDPQTDADQGYVRNGVRTVNDRTIICLEDGQSVVLLARHLRRREIAVDAYLSKWRLPVDYPMVAPGYAAEKRSLALKAGLGKDVRPDKSKPVESESGKPRRRGGTLRPNYGASAPA